MRHAHALPLFQIAAGKSACLDDAANTFDLFVRYHSGRARNSYDMLNARTAQNGNFVLRIEPAEQVTGEDGNIDSFHAIAVSTPLFLSWAVWIESAALQDSKNGQL